MTSVSDVTAAGLAEFLLDRYREEEAAFRHDGSGGDPSPNWSEISGHMLPGFTFERALADLDAKRRIVELHPASYVGDESGEGWACSCSIFLSDAPCPTLRLLALPYVSHPEWRAEWRA